MNAFVAPRPNTRITAAAKPPHAHRRRRDCGGDAAADLTSTPQRTAARQTGQRAANFAATPSYNGRAGDALEVTMNGSRRRFVGVAAAAGAWGLVRGSGAIEAAREDTPAAAGKRMLILGGTSFLGPQLVDAAKARGYSITLFNRGKTRPELFPELEKLRGDRDGNLKALEGRAWDVVVDTSGYVPRVVHDSATLLAGSVKQYIFISTLSVYADASKPGMDETAAVGKLDDETVEKITGESYGPLKALCEKAAEKAMPGRVTVIRPGLIVGPGDPTDRFTYWPVRVSRGGDVLAPGTPADPVQIIDVRDLAEWTLVTAGKGITGVFNAVGPAKELGMGALLEACKKASNSSARLTWVSAAFLDEQKVTPWADMPCWVPPTGDSLGFSRMSAAKAIGAGLTFRDVGVTAKDTLAWWATLSKERQEKLRAGIKPEREAEVLKVWHARAAAN
jgi:2'-hydroxyisoflavone reductase